METVIADQYHAGEATDMNIKRLSERELEKEIMGNRPQEEIIDSFEEEKGIKKKKQKILNLRKRVQVFDVSNDKDKALYEGLMNNSRYEIASFKDHFSNLTNKYTVVCHFVEDMDSKYPPTTIKEEE